MCIVGKKNSENPELLNALKVCMFQIFVNQDPVVQKSISTNPGLSQNSSGNFFAKERLTVLIKYSLDFLRKNLLNPKLQLKKYQQGWKQERG